MNTPTLPKTVEKEIKSIETSFEGIKIVDETSYKNAIDLTKAIKEQGKAIKEQKESFTKPLNESLKNIRAFFKPYEEKLADIEKNLKGSMVQYTIAEQKKADEAAEKLAKRVQKGTMKPETAIRKMNEIEAPEQTTASSTAQATIRETKQVKVSNEALIPREYLMPDMAKIKEAVLKEGKTIDGVEIEVIKSVAIK